MITRPGCKQPSYATAPVYYFVTSQLSKFIPLRPTSVHIVLLSSGRYSHRNVRARTGVVSLTWVKQPVGKEPAAKHAGTLE
jgi:hypothetical protein